MFVSVLMPAYNTGKYIDSSISSILTQSFRDFELLIIDDGSDDDAESIVKKYKNDKRIRYYKKEHTGISDTLNYGIKKANNEIIARLDSDDIAMPYRLEKQLTVFRNNNVDIVSGAYAVFKNNKIQYIIENPEYDEEIKRKLLVHSCIAHSGVMYNKTMILNSGGYLNTPLEDYDLWLRLINMAVFHNLKDVITLVRYRENSESYGNIRTNKLNQIHLQNKYLYNNSEASSDINNEILKNNDIIREYFYGNKLLARKKTIDSVFSGIISIKLLVFFILSLLPFKILENLISARLVPGIKYYLRYFTYELRKCRKVMKDNQL